MHCPSVKGFQGSWVSYSQWPVSVTFVASHWLSLLGVSLPEGWKGAFFREKVQSSSRHLSQTHVFPGPLSSTMLPPHWHFGPRREVRDENPAGWLLFFLNNTPNLAGHHSVFNQGVGPVGQWAPSHSHSLKKAESKSALLLESLSTWNVAYL